MNSVSVTEFKARALSILNTVSRTGEGVVLTKRGKPIAKVTAYGPDESALGGLEGTIIHEGDIVSPIGESEWDAGK